MSIVGTARRDGEAGIEIVDKVGEVGVALLESGKVTQAHFFDQAVLQGLIDTFDPSFGLRRIGTQEVNAQLLHSSPELGLGIALFTAGLIDSKDAVFVAVEGHGFAAALEIGVDQADVIVKALLVYKQQSQQFSGGIVDQHQQCAGGPTLFKPGMRRSIDLDQFSEAGAPLAHLMHDRLRCFASFP